jgi:predicted ArsR family transcriptional regulator
MPMTDLTGAERILVLLFQDGLHRNVIAVARALRVEQTVVRRELDQLTAAGLTRSISPKGHLYWKITDEGRRHVMQRGLVQDAGPPPSL